MATIDQADRALGERHEAAPRWLIALTVLLTLSMLFMAVAETTLWTHFLIDGGEVISLGGLVLILIIGVMLHRRGSLLGSLALIVPWLLYPVITQGDQIIDNLTTNEMRVATHIMLALIFAAPVGLLVVTAKRLLAPSAGRPHENRAWTLLFPGLRLIEEGRTRHGVTLMVLALVLLEIVLAYRYLGELMVLTLVALALLFLVGVSLAEARPAARQWSPRAGERMALVILIAGVGLSFGLYIGFKFRPGAYQGSPHHYHDPTQRDAVYPIEAIVPLPDLGGAYYILDRNYNYAFHNELFIRSTPLLPEFRRTALEQIDASRSRARGLDGEWERLRESLPAESALVSFVDELESYVAFNLRRARLLEEMTARFQRTKAGLQHATHVYEGEGKVLGQGMMQLVDKHRAVAEAPGLAPVTEPFVVASGRVYEAYSNRIVGF